MTPRRANPKAQAGTSTPHTASAGTIPRSGVRPMTPCCPHTGLANQTLGHGKSACELNETASDHSAVVLLHREASSALPVYDALDTCNLLLLPLSALTDLAPIASAFSTGEHPELHSSAQLGQGCCKIIS